MKEVEYDNQYIDLFEKYGVLIDMKIILLTIVHIFKMKDIYEVKDESIQHLSDEEIAFKEAERVRNAAKTKSFQGKIIRSISSLEVISMSSKIENRFIWLNGKTGRY